VKGKLFLKGIILAGGTGSRLWPITKSVNKHLLSVYDKPMIFYPISILMLAGIKEILIITKSDDLHSFKALLSDGIDWGINIFYAIQEKPEGIAQAFLIGEEFIDNDDVVLILGDNIFYGNGLIDKLKIGIENLSLGFSSIISYKVEDPTRFGVVELDHGNNVLSIEEKPLKPKSLNAVTGLYFYTNDVVYLARTLKPSKRGELEITDINNLYLQKTKLKCISLGRGFAWLDTGTNDSLLEASTFVSSIEKRQRYKISAPEEIAYRMGYINRVGLRSLAENYGNSSYGKYLFRLLEEEIDE
jgi:glucose-1-phosphate thymidylyltransferase